MVAVSLKKKIFFKQKTAYEITYGDWSSDVCSSDLEQLARDKMRGALFENFIVTEALKRRYNQGKESNLYFYRDSNQNEVDLLLKKHSGLYGIEIKSAMTYHADFEKALKQMDGWVKETILGKAVAYAGTLENTAGEIKLLNYSHLDEVLA